MVLAVILKMDIFMLTGADAWLSAFFVKSYSIISLSFNVSFFADI